MKRYKVKDMFIDAYKETKRSSILVFLILRLLVIFCMIMQIIHGNINNALLCLLSLILLLLPSIMQQKLNISLPNTLEIIIYLFIFSAEILGEINNFYGIIPHFDTMLHTINGFLCAAVGFSLINLLNEKSEKISLSPLYLCLVAFCFSMTIGVLWEFFEYGVDVIFKTDMQKDKIVTEISTVTLDSLKSNNTVIIENINKTILYDDYDNVLVEIEGGYLDIGIYDTMKDLIVNFIGAVVFIIIGYIYLISNKNDKFISNFVPLKGKRPIPNSVFEKLNKYKNS